MWTEGYIYLYVNSTTQRSWNKIIKNFLIGDFFPLAGNISAIIWNGLKGILRGLEETDLWKNLTSKISWHCPFKSIAEVTSICQLLLLFKYWRGMSDPGLPSGSIIVTTVMANEWEEFSSDQWWDLAIVLGSIPASSDTAESKMKQCWIKYMKIK
jgi:hypothetical protein